MMLFKFITRLTRHKFLVGTAILIIGVGGYLGYKKYFGATEATRYATAQVQKGTLVISVSGTGQISASNQIDLKPKVSGEITSTNIKVGQEVKTGQILIYLDNTDAKKDVADARLDLEENKLKLDKDAAQAPIDYERKQESLKTAKNNLDKKYEEIFNAISNTYLDLPPAITGLRGILYDETMYKGYTNESSYKNLFSDNIDDRNQVTTFTDIAVRDYGLTRKDYDISFLSFKDINRISAKALIEKLLQQTLDTTKSAAQAAKSEKNMLDTIIDTLDKNKRTPSSIITGYQTDLKNYISTINNNLNALLAQKSSLEDAKQSILNIERDLKIMEINNSTGLRPIDLQISQNNIKKKEVALADLEAKLADYNIRAPFDGIIAKVNIKKGESVSPSTALLTIITKQKIAEISLNEVDVAKIKNGEKATLTFDAIPDLTLTGQVIEVGAVGSISQGVVTYTVKISFDTQDERIKTAMSVAAAIITETKSDILLVPNSAIKQQGETSYVEIPDESDLTAAQTNKNGAVFKNAPRRQNIEIGLSNDESTEVTSGLKEGGWVIIRTIQPSARQTQQSNNLRIPGITGGGGGGIRR